MDIFQKQALYEESLRDMVGLAHCDRVNFPKCEALGGAEMTDKLVRSLFSRTNPFSLDEGDPGMVRQLASDAGINADSITREYELAFLPLANELLRKLARELLIQSLS